MIAPTAFVKNVDALFALATRFDERPVHVNDGFFEERFVHRVPGVNPRVVDRAVQLVDVVCAETPTEITGSRRVRNRVGFQRVEKVLIVAAKLDVLQASATAKRVDREVHDMIGFVIGQVELEQLQAAGRWRQ